MMKTTSKQLFKSILNIAGMALSVLCLGYVILIALQQGKNILPPDFSAGDIFVLFIFSAAYSLTLLLIGISWAFILQNFTGDTLPLKEALSNYCITQLAKYLPSNVLHHASRHISLSLKGAGHKELWMALLTETAVVIAASAFLAASGLMVNDLSDALALLPSGYASLIPDFLPLLVWLSLAAFITAGAMLAKKVWRIRAAVLARSFFLTLCFFLLMASLFAGLDYYLTGNWPLIAYFILPLAWLAGFVVPGSPAGLGIREALLLAMLTPISSQADALLVVALFRLVTICGDVICFGTGHAIRALPDYRPTLRDSVSRSSSGGITKSRK